MSSPYTYSPAMTESGAAFISLGPEESFHLCKVLRLRQGDQVLATNGTGYVQPCTISAADPGGVHLQSSGEAKYIAPLPYSLHLAIAPPRHPDRLEWFIEKASETGVDKISLLRCEHSEKWNVKTDRLQRLMVAAMKQSRRAWLPVLQGPLPFREAMQQAVEEERWIAWCEGQQPVIEKQARPGKSVLIAIGPEGDFSPAEVGFASEHGFRAISLGPYRYRTETAALLALHTIHLINSLNT